MAKKASAGSQQRALERARKLSEGYATERPGPGWKQCPGCQGWVRGPQSKGCPKCGHEFTVKPRGGSSASPVSGKARASVAETALSVMKLGGLDKVKAALEEFATDPMMELVIESGGIEQATKALAKLEEEIKGATP